MRKILVVDDDPNIAEVIEQYFDRPEYDVCTMLHGEKVPETVSRIKPDVILLDLKLPDVSGIEVLRNLRREGSEVPVVIITGNVSAETAINTTKEGACEYLPKPFSLDELGSLVDKLATRHAESASESDRASDQDAPQEAEQLVGRSPEMLKIGKTIGQAALSDAPILITGERGSGKELVARLIHRNSSRRDKPFTVINCSYPSSEMLEYELFGRGEDRGQSSWSQGKFELCNGGTVLLESIETVDLRTQGKLLGFIKDKQIQTSRIGTVQADVRILAASSRDLSEAVNAGTFLQELFYGLRVISICTPALRERRSDVPLLAEYFLQRYCRQSLKEISHIAAAAMKLLMSYAWPGNVEELENNLHSAVVMCQSDQILPEHLPIFYEHPLQARLDFQQGEGDYLRLFMQTLEPIGTKLFSELKGEIHERLIDSLEKVLISMSLRYSEGNQVKAADLLGISRNTLRERMLKFGLAKKERAEAPESSDP